MRPLLLLLVAPSLALAGRDFTAPGRYPIGTVTVVFTKRSETTGLPRRLATRIWYPAGAGTMRDGVVHPDAPIAPRRSPLVVFSHGSCGIPDQSVFLTAALASWGFVVAAPSHPGNTLAEYPRCNEPAALADSFANRVADVRFVIDGLLARAGPGAAFAPRVDRRRIGMAGHSFGAQTTLRALATDRRVRAGVALSPPVDALPSLPITDLRIRRPALVMGGELDSLTPFATDVRGAYALLRGPRFLIEIENTGHCAFAAACLPEFCGAGCEPGTTDLADTHRATLRWAVPFLLRYVAGRGVGAALSPAGASSPVRVVEAHPRR